MIDAAGGPLIVALRFLAFVAITGLLGTWFFCRFVLARVAGDAGERHRRWLKAFSVHEIYLAALVSIPALLGHAGSATELRALAVLVDILHIAAAGGWVGALGLVTIACLRQRREPDGPALSAALISAFHPLAMIAAGTVFITGLGTAWLRMGAPVGLASSSYSSLFVAKLLLVGVTGAIGAGHSKLARRRVQTVDMGTVGKTLLAECALAVLVLMVTALLAGTDPMQ